MTAMRLDRREWRRRARRFLAGVSLLIAAGGIWWAVDEIREASLHIAVAAAPPAGWGSYGGDPGGARFSTAVQIDRANVQYLRRAWEFRTGDLARDPTSVARSGFEATPILVGDTLIVCSPFDEVIALDPGTGAARWRFDPMVRRDLQPASNFVCRGVAAWRDRDPARAAAACGSRILLATIDARLIALDARNGAPCRGFGAGGQVKIDPGRPLEWPGEFGMDSAPAIVRDTVVVGSAISDDRHIVAPRGAVRAFDVRTGAPRWQYDPVPTDRAKALADGWPDVPVRTGQGNVWVPISVDPARNMVFLPTSSPSVDFYGGDRPGDNRETTSVVALDASDGHVVWSFQEVHHNLWDYDVPGQPGLYRIRQGGRMRDVVVSAAKTGLLFVLDRDTGKPVFPVIERPVPQGGLPGERLSPTQPIPIRPGLLARARLGPDDAFGITPFDRAGCRRQIAALRNDGLFTPPSIRGTLQLPFSGGGANWGSTSFAADRNIVVVNVNNIAGVLTLRPRRDEEALRRSLPKGQEIYQMTGTPYVATRSLLLSGLGVPCNPPPWGELIGIDMATGLVKWRSTLGTTRDLSPLGLARFKWGTPNLGGPITTAAGLVFIGAAFDNYLRAFDSGTGEELWKGRLPAGGQATPMTYAWRGRQYVVIAAGGNARSRTTLGDSIVAFALP